jgi:hypothetical protein
MKKFLLISLIAFSTFTTTNAARQIGGSPVHTGPTGPVYVNRYWGKFSYESVAGQYQYTKIVGGNTLQSCINAYWSSYYSMVSSPIWNPTGHILFCTAH